MPTDLRKILLGSLIVSTAVGGSFAQLSANFNYQTACDRTVTFNNNSTGYTSVSWAFGDGNSSAIINPMHQYAAGSYMVTLTVSNGALTATSSQPVIIYDEPGASVSGSLSACAEGSGTYSASTTGNNYQWSITAGGIISGQGTPSIDVQWLSSGTGYVELTETNPLGCSATTRIEVVVHPLPVPAFSTPSDSGITQNRLSACMDDNKLYLLVPPLNAGSTYLWEATGGDIVGSNSLDNATVHWNTVGIGTVKVTEISVFGCVGSGTLAVDVVPSPVANFTTADVCFGTEAVFSDQSTGTIATWYWDFGDGVNSYDRFPTHLFTAPGTYDVTLMVSASPLYFGEACADDTTISISVDQNPGPGIICPGTVCAGGEETYTTPSIAGATYIWNVLGGTVTAGGGTSDNEITIAWGNGPVGTISLLVNGTGTDCPFPTVVEIPIVSPNPPISGPTVVCRFATEVYDAPVLPGATYNWTVTGGTILHGRETNSISVYFSTTGAKTITLDVFHDLAECSGQSALNVEVLNPFSLSANNYACAQSTVSYTVYGTPNPTGYTWNWTVTGGSISSGQGTRTINVLWGSGTVGEVVVDAPAGIYCNTRESRNITIKPIPPPVVLSGAMLVCETSTTTYFVPDGFYNSWTATGGTIISGGTGSNFATVQWGTGSTGQITVTREDRTTWPYCPTTTNFTVDISDNNPITISGPTPVCSNSIHTYTSSSNASYPHLWEVTGGTILSGLGTNSISVQWGTGLFGTVSVTELICNNTELLTIEIITPDAPMIDTAGASCVGNSLTLYIPGDYAGYVWNTGAIDTFITITTPGTYSVTVTDQFGCSAEGSVTMNALPTLPTPSAFITGSGPAITPILVLELTAFPSDHQYLWSNGVDKQSTYVSAVGTYFVTVTNEYGCSDVASADVTSTPAGGLQGGGGSCGGGGGGGGGSCPLLFPDFTFSNCNPIQFTNTTLPSALAYLWRFGDSDYAWGEHPIHDYAAAGSYTVTLYATDNGTCWSVIQHTVNITSFLQPAFNFTQACPPSPVQFTDISNSNLPITGWQWDFGDASSSTLQNPSHSYAAPGLYTVELTITDGVCMRSFSDTVRVHELNAAFNYQEACLGMTTLFMDNSTGSRRVVRWRWDFGDGTDANRKNPAHKYPATGSYNVALTVTDVSGCTASISNIINVIQFNAGNVSYTPPTTFCYGGSLLIDAPSGAGFTYRWSIGETAQSITAKQTGAYYVVVTETGGCRDTLGPVSVLVYPPPFAYITANGPLKFCEYGAYTTLAASPSGAGFSYEWRQNGSQISTSQSVGVNNVFDSGSYEVIVTDNHGCKDTSVAVVVNIYPNPPYPNITASGPTEFCEGGSVVLTAPAGYSYQWTNGSTTQSATILTGGFHSVTIADVNGCAAVGYQNVVVKPLPDMSLVAYGCYDVCVSDSNRVYGPPAMTDYLWSNGETTQSILIDAAGTYSLTATNHFGCSNSSSNLYISTTNFLGVDLGNDVSFCDGGTATFDAGIGFTSYQWQDNSANQTFIAAISGTYFVDVTDANGCLGSDTVLLTVFPNPVVDLHDTTICDVINIVLDAGTGFSYLWNDNSASQTLNVTSAGNYSVTVTDANSCTDSDNANVSLANSTSPLIATPPLSTICEGESVQLNVTGGTTFAWSPPATLDNASISNPIATPTVSTSYIVSALDASGCAKADTVQINVLPIFSASINSASPLCFGESIQLNVNGGTTYSWSPTTGLSCPDCSNPVANPAQTTDYSVTVSANGYCNTETLTVTVPVNPLPEPELDSEITISYGSQVTLTPNGGFDNYDWTSSGGWSCEGCPNPTISPAVTTTYTLVVTDSNNCTASKQIIVEVLSECEGKFFIPTAFSPNGDTHNDIFRIIHPGDLQLIDFKVFNRWGEIVFETTDPDQGWNGFFQGGTQDLSVFAYYAQMTCGNKVETVIGNVTLVH